MRRSSWISVFLLRICPCTVMLRQLLSFMLWCRILLLHIPILTTTNRCCTCGNSNEDWLAVVFYWWVVFCQMLYHSARPSSFYICCRGGGAIIENWIAKDIHSFNCKNKPWKYNVQKLPSWLAYHDFLVNQNYPVIEFCSLVILFHSVVFFTIRCHNL